MKRLASAFADKFVRLAATGYFNGAAADRRRLACEGRRVYPGLGGGATPATACGSDALRVERRLRTQDLLPRVCRRRVRLSGSDPRLSLASAVRFSPTVGWTSSGGSVLARNLGAVAGSSPCGRPEARRPSRGRRTPGYSGACAAVPCSELARPRGFAGADDLYDDELGEECWTDSRWTPGFTPGRCLSHQNPRKVLCPPSLPPINLPPIACVQESSMPIQMKMPPVRHDGDGDHRALGRQAGPESPLRRRDRRHQRRTRRRWSCRRLMMAPWLLARGGRGSTSPRGNGDPRPRRSR